MPSAAAARQCRLWQSYCYAGLDVFGKWGWSKGLHTPRMAGETLLVVVASDLGWLASYQKRSIKAVGAFAVEKSIRPNQSCLVCKKTSRKCGIAKDLVLVYCLLARLYVQRKLGWLYLTDLRIWKNCAMIAKSQKLRLELYQTETKQVNLTSNWPTPIARNHI